MWVAQLCSRRAVLDGELVLTSAHRHAVPLPALCARHAVQDGGYSARCRSCGRSRDASRDRARRARQAVQDGESLCEYVAW